MVIKAKKRSNGAMVTVNSPTTSLDKDELEEEESESERKRSTSIDRLIDNFFDIVGFEDLSEEIIEEKLKSAAENTSQKLKQENMRYASMPTIIDSPRRLRRAVLDDDDSDDGEPKVRVAPSRTSSNGSTSSSSKKESKFSFRPFLSRRKSIDIDKDPKVGNETSNKPPPTRLCRGIGRNPSRQNL